MVHPSSIPDIRTVARAAIKSMATEPGRIVRRVLGIDERERRNLQNAAHELVTPFAGFVLSNAFLSREVDKWRLNFLNDQSTNLRGSKEPLSPSVVFVQVDQIEEFYEQHLERLTTPFTLITGKWQLPGLEPSRFVNLLLESGRLRAWFSQNQVYAELPIRPFPYGVNLWSAPTLLRIRSQYRRSRPQSLYIPHCRIHTHLSQESRYFRELLVPDMDRERSLGGYLKKIAQSYFVVCPPGDRPDTYRHWEAIALGAVPVCAESDFYTRLLGDAVVQVEPWNLKTLAQPNGAIVPGTSLASVARWRELISTTL